MNYSQDHGFTNEGRIGWIPNPGLSTKSGFCPKPYSGHSDTNNGTEWSPKQLGSTQDHVSCIPTEVTELNDVKSPLRTRSENVLYTKERLKLQTRS